MKRLLVFLLYMMQIVSVAGDQRAVADPISVTHAYKGGLSVRVSKNEHGRLSEVVVTYEDKSISVPAKHLENIFNPILGTVYLVEYPTDGDSHKSLQVSLEFENRVYEWGMVTHRVAYYLRGGELQVKEMTVPVAKGEYKVFDEFKK